MWVLGYHLSPSSPGKVNFFKFQISFFIFHIIVISLIEVHLHAAFQNSKIPKFIWPKSKIPKSQKRKSRFPYYGVKMEKMGILKNPPKKSRKNAPKSPKMAKGTSKTSQFQNWGVLRSQLSIKMKNISKMTGLRSIWNRFRILQRKKGG